MEQRNGHTGDRLAPPRRSLSRDMTVILAILMGGALAVLMTVDYIHRSHQLHQEAEIKAQRVMDSVAGMLREDSAALPTLLDNFVRNHEIETLRVFDVDGQLVFESVKQEAARGDVLMETRELGGRNEPPGRIEAAFSLEGVHQQLQATFWVMIIIFVVVMVFLVSTTSRLIRIRLRRPLLPLKTGMARVAQGEFDTAGEAENYEEFAGISKTFSIMVSRLKDREEALRGEIAERQRAEQRYALAVKGANDGIWDWDLVNGSIYFSARWKEIIGFNEDEFPNDIEEWKKRIHPDDRQRVVDAHHNFMAGLVPTLDLEYRLQHKDGSWRMVHAQGASLTDESGEPVRIAGANTDITERYEAQQALKESDEQYRAIVESYDGFIYICDKDYRITFMNRRLEERTGRLALGEPCHKAVHGLDERCAWCIMDKVMKGQTIRREVHSPVDGRWYYVVNTPILHPDGSVSKQAMFQDITERKRADQALRDNEERYRTLIETTAEGFVLLNLDLTIQDTNQALCDMLGRSRSDIIGRDLLEFMDDESREVILAQATRWEDTPHRLYEFSFKRASGEHVDVLASSTTMFDPQGKAKGSFVFLTDITDRKRMENQLRYQAMHDPLTGLSNRTLCLDRISRALERARRRSNYYYAVIFLDLDRFKVINDSLGHTLGDQLLIETSHRLLECVRDLDTVSRFGGDEYIVLLEELGSPRKAIQVVKRMRQALRRPYTLDNHEVQLTASIGIVLGPTDFKKPEDILQYANIAMHRAKSKGRDRFKVFTSKLLDHAIQQMALENHMERAMAEGQFFLHYQPIIRMGEGSRLYGFEALARWDHPSRGIIPPDEFIPVAEETGMIMDLGLWVLAQAARTMVQWMEAHPRARDLILSVNISGRQFSQHDLASKIRRLLDQIGLPPHQLKLEITETALMENAATAVDTLRQLKQLGVTLSIDDFGTGYSSMSYLQRLPLDNLKIDLSFVQMLDLAPENIEIVKAIINLAHSLELEVVAEGVERVTHQEILTGLDCDYCQGYLYARPMKAEDAEDFITNMDNWELPN